MRHFNILRTGSTIFPVELSTVERALAVLPRSVANHSAAGIWRRVQHHCAKWLADKRLRGKGLAAACKLEG